MKYLGAEPFASKPATDAYRLGWELAFPKKKPRKKPEREIDQATADAVFSALPPASKASPT